MAAPETIGRNIIITGSAASSHLDEETKASLGDLDPEAWYPIERLLPIIDKAVAAGPRTARIVGRSVIYALKKKLKEMGIDTPEKALVQLEEAYRTFNRGDGMGHWHTEISDDSAVITDTTIYDCRFNEGIIEGLVMAFGGRFTEFSHERCRRDGNEACRYVISWTKR